MAGELAPERSGFRGLRFAAAQHNGLGRRSREWRGGWWVACHEVVRRGGRCRESTKAPL
ncbi:hypothetical protein AZ78_4766 [Lysobacter capsici AZ78]|uniref:Uncharacterized protein n=1 Tax=Lysobacter capsici AZ78 TaxID=1444315 RepID=A0A120AI59_9GAMM|nr:hypothetical protein AZ78_4766 [Lysobacter capsici AZ78]